jgi:hypothetical protein
MSSVKDLFQKERDAWLDLARSEARKLLRYRDRITIEDVLEKAPRPEYIHPNTTGNVFRVDDFKPVGWLASRRVSMNGRPVRVWTLVK